MLTGAFFHAGTWSSFRQRNHGAPGRPRRIPGHRFVAYLQNHDQIGNRATGDRLTQTLSPGLLRVGATLLFCSPFTPMLFMGEEWGAPHAVAVLHQPPRAGAAATRSARAAGGVRRARLGRRRRARPQRRATFAGLQARLGGAGKHPHATLLTLHRELIALRKAWPDLSDPWLDGVEIDIDEEARTVVLQRGRLRVAVNLGADPVTLALGPITRILLASEPVQGEEGALTVPAEAFAIAHL